MVRCELTVDEETFKNFNPTHVMFPPCKLCHVLMLISSCSLLHHLSLPVGDCVPGAGPWGQVGPLQGCLLL